MKSICTVDGSNPAPVDMVNIPLFTGFHTCWVVQDFIHQQYVDTYMYVCLEEGRDVQDFPC